MKATAGGTPLGGKSLDNQADVKFDRSSQAETGGKRMISMHSQGEVSTSTLEKFLHGLDMRKKTTEP